MSLINQMLRDLENRSEGPVLEQQEVLQGLGSTGQTVTTSQRKPAGITYIFIVILSVVCIFLLFERFGNMLRPEGVVAEETPNPVQSEEQKPLTTPSRTTIPVTNKHLAETIAVIELPEWQDTSTDLVYELLPQSTDSVRQEDMRDETDPELVLTGVIENQSKADMLGQLQEKISNGEVRIENTADAEVELSAALLSKQTDTMYWDALERMEQPEVTIDSAMKQDAISNQESPVRVQVEKPVPDSVNEYEQFVDTANESSAQFSRTPAHKGDRELALEHYQKAVIQLRRRKQNQAIDSLKLAVNLDQRLSDARILLATQLLAKGEKWEAEKTLVAGLQKMPEDAALAYAYARILVAQGKISGALNILNRGQPQLEANPEYHAFSAALHQRVEDHQAAIRKYSEVLKVRPDKGVWWMGLGISLQADGQQQRALQAFKTALRDNSLTNSVRQYLSDRISVLQGATS